VSFRLPLAQLAEVLGAFAAASSAADDDHGAHGHGAHGAAAADTAPLIMTYPGPDGELVLELRLLVCWSLWVFRRRRRRRPLTPLPPPLKKNKKTRLRDEGTTSTTTTDAPLPRRRRCTVLTYARVATLGAGLIGGGGAGRGRHHAPDEAPIEGEENDDEGDGDREAGGSALAMDADWEDPTSCFIAAHQAHMLKEAADDLEWPMAAAGLASSAGAGAWGRLTLTRDPPTLALSAAVGGSSGAVSGGERSVEVSVPVDDLAAFCCSGPEVSHAYPLRALRSALGHVPTAPAAALAAAAQAAAGGGGGGGGVQHQQNPPPPAAAVEYTKVRVDARGLLSVAHMLRVAAGGGGAEGGGGGGRRGGDGGGAAAAALMGPTQMAEGRAGGALVQYVVQPLAEEQDDYAF
jgi:hypothetical protein